MSEVTVKTLAEEIGTPIDRLLQQFSDAGIAKNVDANVSQTEKQALLNHLQKEHGSDGNTDGAPTRLTLQRKTRSTLSVSGSGGKSKNVQVEVRKKRTYVKRSALEDEQRAAEDAVKREAEAKAQREADMIASQAAEEAAKRSAEEAATRQAEEQRKAEETAKREAEEKLKRDAEDKANRTEEDKRKADQKAKRTVADKQAKLDAEVLQRRLEQEAKRKAEEESQRQLEEARKMAEQNEKNGVKPEQAVSMEKSDYHTTTSTYARAAEDEQDRKEETSRRRKKKKPAAKQDERGGRGGRNQRGRGKPQMNKPASMQHGFDKTALVAKQDVIIGETIVVSELANKMSVKGVEVIKVMMKMGAMATINQVIDQETASLVAEEMEPQGYST